jgi:putative transposase
VPPALGGCLARGTPREAEGRFWPNTRLLRAFRWRGSAPVHTGPNDQERPTADIIELARRRGRLGYRKITAFDRRLDRQRQVGREDLAAWVERIWRREGLNVPAKQSKQGRIWLADGSCIRLRAERHNHVRSYDFVEDRTHEGRKYRMLNLID